MSTLYFQAQSLIARPPVATPPPFSIPAPMAKINTFANARLSNHTASLVPSEHSCNLDVIETLCTADQIRTEILRQKVESFDDYDLELAQEITSAIDTLEEAEQITAANGTYYGEVANGKKHGLGRASYNTGSSYEGDWVDDKIEGVGVFKFSSGEIYFGEFKDSKRHGIGLSVFTDGGRYQGNFQDDKRHGRGIRTFASGAHYIGVSQNDNLQGCGVYTFPDGKMMMGMFRNNQLAGKAAVFGVNGSFTIGNFGSRNWNGQTAIRCTNGSLYKGGFHDGRLDGSGILVENGRVTSKFYHQGQDLSFPSREEEETSSIEGMPRAVLERAASTVNNFRQSGTLVGEALSTARAEFGLLLSCGSGANLPELFRSSYQEELSVCKLHILQCLAVEGRVDGNTEIALGQLACYRSAINQEERNRIIDRFWMYTLAPPIERAQEQAGCTVGTILKVTGVVAGSFLPLAALAGGPVAALAFTATKYACHQLEKCL